MARIKELPAKITAEFLIQQEACRGMVSRFKEVFPRGAAVTLANLRKAEKAGLMIHWLVGRVVNLGADCPLCLEEERGHPDVARVALDLLRPFIAK